MPPQLPLPPRRVRDVAAAELVSGRYAVTCAEALARSALTFWGLPIAARVVPRLRALVAAAVAVTEDFARIDVRLVLLVDVLVLEVVFLELAEPFRIDPAMMPGPAQWRWWRNHAGLWCLHDELDLNSPADNGEPAGRQR
jgi:hypothetical protein